MLFYRCILPFLTFNLPRLLRRLTLLQGLLPPLAFFGFRALRFICRIGGNANIEVVAIIENNDDIERYFKKNLTKNEIIIGMGAGVISKYMRRLKTVL